MFWKEPPTQEYLGHIITPTGTILIADFGLLNLWRHDTPPTMPSYLLDTLEEIERINNAIDLKIVGPDALEAGHHFDRGWHPEYLYDIPRDGVEKVKQLFNDCLQQHRLDASLEILDNRVTHRQRVELALQFGNGAGEISYHGIWAVVIGGLPKQQKLSVYGERMKEEQWNDRWRWIVLEVRHEHKATSSRKIGQVLVDRARLVMADVDALAEWVHDDPLDDQADFVFWGRDASTLTEKVGANTLSEGTFGWRDLPVEEAVKVATATHQLCNQQQLKVALDFRPHSHPYILLEQIRSSETESGILELNEATLCGFMTSWGDGIFPILGEFDRDNQLVRVRIDLGNDETVNRMERMLN